MIGWERIVVSSVSLPENKRYQGRNIKEICEERGCDPAALTAELLVSERGKVGVILMSMAQEDVDTVAKLPYSAVISDSLYGAPDFPHPRLYGSFAKIIRDAVRERKLFPLETAVHKMTGMTAARFGIPARGVLREGAAADLNLFDPAAFGDRATFGEPKQPASGMEAVLLGGETVWRRGRRTGRLGARVLLCGRR
jgi:N-acyl-D-amino-acid deacylase